MNSGIDDRDSKGPGGARRPLFSVIMPAYNSQDYLAEAIESVLAQEFSDWELLIVDDGSTDHTLAIATRYAEADRRIRVFSQENAGTAAARNNALEHASAPWALMLDSDDMLLPHCMSAYVGFMGQQSGHTFYSCNGVALYSRGRARKVYRGRRGRTQWSATLEDVLSVNPVMLPGAVVQMSALAAAGGFAAGQYNEDHGLWIRLLMEGYTHRYCPETLVIHRQTATSKTKDWVRVAASSLDIVRSLDLSALSALGLCEDWRLAVRRWESAVVFAGAQERVAKGGRKAAVQHLWRERKSLVWSLKNILRVVAIAFAFPLYRNWLVRSK